jgi:hypothetical protein
MQKEKKRKNFLLEAGDHIHIPRKDMNLAVIKPPTGLASSLTLLKTQNKERISGELQKQIQRKNTYPSHRPCCCSASRLLHPGIQYYCTGRGRGEGKKHTQRTRSSSEAIEALHRKRERERERDRRSAPLPKNKNKRESSAASLSAASAAVVCWWFL